MAVSIMGGNMQKILLAIDGVAPNERTFRYAVQLCRKINAELNVLQIIRQRKKVACRRCAGSHYARDSCVVYEGSGIESSPAQKQIRRFLAESEDEGVRCRFIVKAGNPDQEIIKFIDTYWDVVIAVYDSPMTRFGKAIGKFRKNADRGWIQNLRIPIVTVREKRLFMTIKYFLKEGWFMLKFFCNIKNKIAKPREDKHKIANLSHAAGDETSMPAEMAAQPLAKLVVLGKGVTFSDEIVEYALEMAQRMEYEIIALNTAPLSCESFNLFSSSRHDICQEFQEMSIKNAALFQAQAEKRGLHFIHRINFVDTDTALEEVQNEFGENISFIVSEPEEDQATVSRATNEKRPEAEIFVYSMK
jgi:hypothetical protein